MLRPVSEQDLFINEKQTRIILVLAGIKDLAEAEESFARQLEQVGPNNFEELIIHATDINKDIANFLVRLSYNYQPEISIYSDSSTLHLMTEALSEWKEGKGKEISPDEVLFDVPINEETSIIPSDNVDKQIIPHKAIQLISFTALENKNKDLLALLLRPGAERWLAERKERDKQGYVLWQEQIPIILAGEIVALQTILLKKSPASSDKISHLLKYAALEAKNCLITNFIVEQLQRGGGYFDENDYHAIKFNEKNIPCKTSDDKPFVIKFFYADKFSAFLLYLQETFNSIIKQYIPVSSADVQKYVTVLKNGSLQIELEKTLANLKLKSTKHAEKVNRLYQLTQEPLAIKDEVIAKANQTNNWLPPVLQTYLSQSKDLVTLQQLQYDINTIKTDAGNTLLHVAVLRRDLPMVTFLLSYGADPLIENSKKETAFKLAAKLDQKGELLSVFLTAFKDYLIYIFGKLDRIIIEEDTQLCAWEEKTTAMYKWLNQYLDILIVQKKNPGNFFKRIFYPTSRLNERASNTADCFQVIEAASNQFDLTNMKKNLLAIKNNASTGIFGHSRLFNNLLKIVDTLENDFDPNQLAESSKRYYQLEGAKMRDAEIINLKKECAAQRKQIYKLQDKITDLDELAKEMRMFLNAQRDVNQFQPVTLATTHSFFAEADKNLNTEHQHYTNLNNGLI